MRELGIFAAISKILVGIQAFRHTADVYAQLDIWATLYLVAKGHASSSISGKAAREISDRAYVPPYSIAKRDMDTTKATAGFTGSVIVNAGVTASAGVSVKGQVADFFKALVGAEKDNKPLFQAGEAWQLFSVRLRVLEYELELIFNLCLQKEFGAGHYGKELAASKNHPIPESCPATPGSPMEVVQALSTLSEKKRVSFE